MKEGSRLSVWQISIPASSRSLLRSLRLEGRFHTYAKTVSELKKSLGHLAYGLEGINSLSSIQACHARVEYDGGEFEGDFIYGAVSNSLSIGGMLKLDPELVNLSDGRFEILLIHQPLLPLDLSNIIAGLLNQDYEASRCLKVLQCSRVKFTFDQDVPWTRDGEDGGAHRELELVCHSRAVRLCC